MPRRPREELEGAIHHVYARGNNHCLLFVDPVDRHAYLELIGVTVADLDWLCLAYCLMGTHVHLLVETRRPNLGIGLQRAHGRYAHLFNSRHGRSGHLFHGRYGSKRVTTDAQLLTVVDYIDRNPVDAGLAATAAQWPWGSAGARARGHAPHWLATRRLAALRRGIAGARR
jgi:putative transposase